ncbi:MAG: secretion protein HlyD family protein, partial [Acidobacteria bacterium]|nr:secretion protein HlyD family protein [Acidobacteriota bacterium]
MKRNGNRLFFILIVALIAGCFSAGCGLWDKSGDNRISLSGNIELTQVNLAFKTAGKLVDLPIEEGTEVRQGAVIAHLDADQLQKQQAREQASLAVAESQMVQQKTAIQYQKASLEADIEMRQAALRQVEARLQQLLAGSRAQEIQQAKAQAEEARTQHALAKEDWERAQVLYKNDDISSSQRDQYKARFDATQAALKQAEERHSLVLEGPRKEDIEAARAQVEQASASVKLSEAARLELRRREEELVTRKAQIEQARAQLAIVESQIADATVMSPINGIVLVKSAEVGEILAAGTTLATLGDLDKPWLRGYIKEQDL